MSEYGRLWQQVSDIRRTLRRMFPEADTSTLAKAQESVARADRLLTEWADLERRMARTDS